MIICTVRSLLTAFKKVTESHDSCADIIITFDNFCDCKDLDENFTYSLVIKYETIYKLLE